MNVYVNIRKKRDKNYEANLYILSKIKTSKSKEKKGSHRIYSPNS